MCGICGAMSLDGPLDPAIAAALPAMCHAIRHRGPDGEGRYVDETVALGHRRLAIIDRAGGAQPMSNEDGSCQIVFNGEIYNHRSLRSALVDRGHVFRTASDTEAIVHAYEEYGPACLERLEGMFAFAIYDRRRRELFIARDRLGKKPLFFAVLDRTLHFGSEIKALACSPAWDDTVDLSSLAAYLCLGYFMAPNTVYRHVHKLEPGHYLRARNGGIEIRKYWDVEEFDTDRREEAALVADVDGLLQQCVDERLESEVPLGAFLSGGIDSGLVVSAMATALDRRPLTMSVGFNEGAPNELEAARATAVHCRTEHYAETVVPALEQVLDPVVRAFDEPFADASAIPTYYVSGVARRHVTVAMSGDGGDEAFGGYDFRYVPHALESTVRSCLPGGRARRATHWAGVHWPTSRRLPRALRLGTILQNIGTDAATAYYADLCFVKPATACALVGRPWTGNVGELPGHDAVTAPYRACTSPSVVQRAQYADVKVYLPNDVLVKVDRMSMAHSLEVRSPLLDRRLVELAFRIPVHRKMPGLRAKHLLRMVARRRLTHDIARRPKQGFEAPMGRWIAGAYARMFEDDVLGSNSHVSAYLDVSCVRRLFDAHRRGAADHAYSLWAIWMFERWSRVARTAAQSPKLMPVGA